MWRSLVPSLAVVLTILLGSTSSLGVSISKNTPKHELAHMYFSATGTWDGYIAMPHSTASITKAGSEECLFTNGGAVSVTTNNICVNEKGAILGGAFTNVLLWTSDLSVSGTWTTVTASVATTTDASYVPDPAWDTYSTITDTTDNAAHGVVQAFTSTANRWIATAFVRPGTLNWVALTMDDANFAWFNASTCTTGTKGSWGRAAAEMYGSWCRIMYTRQADQTAATKNFGIYVSNADNTLTYAGSGTGTVEVWGSTLHVSAYNDGAAGPVANATSTAAVVPRSIVTLPALSVNDMNASHCTSVRLKVDPLAWQLADGASPKFTYAAVKVLGSTTTATNAESMMIGDGYVYYQVKDSAGNASNAIVTVGTVTDAYHTYTGCYDKEQSKVAVYIDNVQIGSSGNFHASWVGFNATNARYVGGDTVLRSPGAVKGVKICKTANPYNCQIP